MKLGEALTIRSDLQKRVAQLGGGLASSAVVQEGDAPPEDPAALLAELDELSAELERLIAVTVMPRTVTGQRAQRTFTTRC